MSEEQNDSPAFRLRPRRAAPKSYYTVRLEYSANPAAFVRERPRSSLKRRVFSQKSGGANAAAAGATAKYQHQSNNNYRLPVPSKEERELDERRVHLHRNSLQSITTDTPISPFIERLEVGELSPQSIYEHNYITARIKKVERPSPVERLLVCLCQSIDCSSEYIRVHLHDEYANENLVRQDKLISIAKFKTSVAHRMKDQGAPVAAAEDELRQTMKLEKSTANEGCSLRDTVTMSGSSAQQLPNSNLKPEPEGGVDTAPPTGAALPFDVIVKYEEFTERSSGGGSSGGKTTSSSSLAGLKRPLIPFVSITDMIEHPTEPFVEMSV